MQFRHCSLMIHCLVLIVFPPFPPWISFMIAFPLLWLTATQLPPSFFGPCPDSLAPAQIHSFTDFSILQALQSLVRAWEWGCAAGWEPGISLVPRLSRNVNMYRVESLVSFLHKHDVIKIGQKQKGNVLRVVQPTMLQGSVCMIFDARQLDTCSKLSATFVPFSVLSLIRPRTIRWRLPRVYLSALLT